MKNNAIVEATDMVAQQRSAAGSKDARSVLEPGRGAPRSGARAKIPRHKVTEIQAAPAAPSPMV
jgi:hypothetical protein